MEPPEPERAAEAREARRSGEFIYKLSARGIFPRSFGASKVLLLQKKTPGSLIVLNRFSSPVVPLISRSTQTMPMQVPLQPMAPPPPPPTPPPAQMQQQQQQQMPSTCKFSQRTPRKLLTPFFGSFSCWLFVSFEISFTIFFHFISLYSSYYWGLKDLTVGLCVVFTPTRKIRNCFRLYHRMNAHSVIIWFCFHSVCFIFLFWFFCLFPFLARPSKTIGIKFLIQIGLRQNQRPQLLLSQPPPYPCNLPMFQTSPPLLPNCNSLLNQCRLTRLKW